MPTEPWKQLQDAAPTVMTLLLAAALIVGAILWLSGKRLARPACAVSGLLLGGLGGWALGNQLGGTDSYLLPLMIGAAVAGALVAAFLFRVWMSLSGAVILAVIVPAASLVWQGTTPPTVQITQETLPALTPAASPEEPQGVWSQLTEAGRTAYQEQRELLRTWWDEMGTTGRGLILVSSAIGFIVGLLIGLIKPHFSASIQSALLGSILIFLTGRQLLLHHLPEQSNWLPTTPRGAVLTVSLITVAGLAIQWMLFRRSADKE